MPSGSAAVSASTCMRASECASLPPDAWQLRVCSAMTAAGEVATGAFTLSTDTAESSRSIFSTCVSRSGL